MEGKAETRSYAQSFYPPSVFFSEKVKKKQKHFKCKNQREDFFIFRSLLNGEAKARATVIRAIFRVSESQKKKTLPREF